MCLLVPKYGEGNYVSVMAISDSNKKGKISHHHITRRDLKISTSWNSYFFPKDLIIQLQNNKELI